MDQNLNYTSDSENFDADVSICTPSRRPCQRPAFKRAKQRVVVNDENSSNVLNKSHNESFRKPKGLRPTDSINNIVRNVEVTATTEKSVIKSKTPVHQVSAPRAKEGKTKTNVRFQVFDPNAGSKSTNAIAECVQTPKRDSPNQTARKEMAGRTPFASDVLNTSDDVLDNVFGTQGSPAFEYDASLCDLLGHNFAMDTMILSNNNSPLQAPSPLREEGYSGPIATTHDADMLNIDLLGATSESCFIEMNEVNESFDIMEMVQGGTTQQEKDGQLVEEFLAEPELQSPKVGSKHTLISTTPRLNSTATVASDTSIVYSHQKEISYVPHSAKKVASPMTTLTIAATPEFVLPCDNTSEENEPAAAHGAVNAAAVQAASVLRSPAMINQRESPNLDGVSLSRPRMMGRRIPQPCVASQLPTTAQAAGPREQPHVSRSDSQQQFKANSSPMASYAIALKEKAVISPCIHSEPLQNAFGDSPVPRPFARNDALPNVTTTTEYLLHGRKDLAPVPLEANHFRNSNRIILSGTAGRVPVIFDRESREQSFDSSSDEESFPHNESHKSPSKYFEDSQYTVRQTGDASVENSEWRSILIDESMSDDEIAGLEELLPEMQQSAASVTTTVRSQSRFGTPGRVLRSSADASEDEQEEEEEDYEGEFENSLDETCNSNNATAMNAEDMIDNTLSEADNLIDVNSSGVFSLATTITVDMSQCTASSSKPCALAVTRRHRRKDFEDCDVKEILLVSSPYKTTSTVICFANKNRSTLYLSANAIEVRFDPLNASHSQSQSQAQLSVPSFAVSPNHLQVEPGTDATFKIDFAPQVDVPGNFTGVLKIRSHGKTHMLLLRGESRASEKNKQSSDYEDDKGTGEEDEQSVSSFNNLNSDGSGSIVAPIGPQDAAHRSHVESANNTSVSILLSSCESSPSRSFASDMTLSRMPQLLRDASIMSRNSIRSAIKPTSAARTAVATTSATLANTSPAAPSASNHAQKTQPSPFTPQEEIMKRHALLKEWIGRIKERVDSAEARIHSKAEYLPLRELDAPSEVMLTSQLLQGDLFISGNMNLTNNTNGDLLVDISFSTEFLRLLNYEQTAVSISAFSTLELPVVLAIISYSALLSSASQNYQIVGNKMRVGSAFVSYSLPNSARAVQREVAVWAKVSDADLSTIDCSQLYGSNTSALPSSGSAVKAASASAAAAPPSPLVTAVPQYGSYLPRHYLPTARSMLAPSSKPSGNTAISNNSNNNGRADKGIYFKQRVLDFGCCIGGSFNRMKVDLYNTTDEEVLVTLKDPSLPFVLIHNEIQLRPRCFVRVPIRFVPVSVLSKSSSSSTSAGRHSQQHVKSYSAVLVAESAAKSINCTIELVATSY